MSTADPSYAIVPFAKLFPDYTTFGWQKILGRGSFATVYAAKIADSPASDGDAVAVKVFDEVDAWEREAGLLSKLKHNNIVDMEGVARSTESEHVLCCLIMQRMEGSLEKLVLGRGGSPAPLSHATLRHRVTWLYQIASALEYLHANGVIHGDLKPANVMLDGLSLHATVKVIDFGLATLRHADGSSVRNAGGTALYMDPALLDGTGRLSESNDIYSFAILGWQLITGRLPFQEELASMAASRQGSGLRRLVCAREGRPSLDDASLHGEEELQHVLVNCWAATPSHRPPASEVAWKLADILENHLAAHCDSESDLVPAAVSSPPAPAPEVLSVPYDNEYAVKYVDRWRHTHSTATTCLLDISCTDEQAGLLPVHLHVLLMPNCQLVTNGSLARMRNLVELDMSECVHITDDTLGLLVNLQKLFIVACSQITGDCFRSLKQLNYLRMRGCSQITDATLCLLADSLLQLNMVACEAITDVALLQLKHLTTLVMLGCRQITDGCLATLTKLTYLVISDCQQITDAGIAPLTGLNVLLMNNCHRITDEGIKGFNKLVNLDISNCTALSDNAIAGLTTLETLTMANCYNITAHGVRGLTNLSILHMWVCKVPDAGLETLRYLTNVDMRYCTSITDAGLVTLSQSQKLETLTMHGCHHITDAGLGCLTTLGYLDMTNCTKITDASLCKLVHLGTLLMNNCTQISDTGIKSLEHLTVLHMRNCTRITEDGLLCLTQLKELEMASTARIRKERLLQLKHLSKVNGTDIFTHPLLRN